MMNAEHTRRIENTEPKTCTSGLHTVAEEAIKVRDIVPNENRRDVVVRRHAETQDVGGLGDVDDLSPLQQAFRDHHALQCGFCTPGMLMTATDLLETAPASIADDDIRDAISGNLCRCTGYEHIVRAIRAAIDARDGRTDA